MTRVKSPFFSAVWKKLAECLEHAEKRKKSTSVNTNWSNKKLKSEDNKEKISYFSQKIG